jgi:hypothetical protein
MRLEAFRLVLCLVLPEGGYPWLNDARLRAPGPSP